MFFVTWIIQILVYPTFGRLTQNQFQKRQKIYVPVVVLITLPLMSIQLFGHFQQLWKLYSPIQLFQCILVLSTWIVTFLFAIPTHAQLRIQGNKSELTSRLVKIHWIRTLAWSIILILDFIKY